MLLCFLGTIVYAVVQPYINFRDNILGTLSNVQVFLVMMAALAMQYHPLDNTNLSTDSSYDDKAMGIFLIIVNVIGVALFFIYALINYIFPPTDEEVAEEAIHEENRNIFNVFESFKARVSRLSSMSSQRQLVLGGSGSARDHFPTRRPIAKITESGEIDETQLEMQSVTTDRGSFFAGENPMAAKARRAEGRQEAAAPPKKQEAAASPKKQRAWKKVFDEQLNAYYYDESSNETTWTKPNSFREE